MLFKVTVVLIVMVAIVMTVGGANQQRPHNTEDDPSAKELLQLLKNGHRVGGYYDMEDDKPARISIYQFNGVFFWTADMSIDCDGIMTDKCNPNTDSTYQNDTSLHTSNGLPLNAEFLPYVVLPGPSNRWDYRANNIQLGALVILIYKGQVRYGVFGDVDGNSRRIGEASYAMAKSFGINRDPVEATIEGAKVVYIVVSGSHVSPVESHEAAVILGKQLARKLISDNSTRPN